MCLFGPRHPHVKSLVCVCRTLCIISLWHVMCCRLLVCVSERSGSRLVAWWLIYGPAHLLCNAHMFKQEHYCVCVVAQCTFVHCNHIGICSRRWSYCCQRIDFSLYTLKNKDSKNGFRSDAIDSKNHFGVPQRISQWTVLTLLKVKVLYWHWWLHEETSMEYVHAQKVIL